MIEKVMRAVKSSNKKRGRNVTIGAVVGILLSCTVVMGADTGKYLWIKGDGGIIKFNTLPTTKEDGADGEWKKENPYDDENSWTGSIYINNITLTGTDNGKDEYNSTIGYGLKLSGDLGENFEFINNGIITGTGKENGYGYGDGIGIYNSGDVKNLKNNGIITGTSPSTRGSATGIYNSGDIKNLKNKGIITGTGSSNGYGIYNSRDIKNLKNKGIITGTGSSNGDGIRNYSLNRTSVIESLKNNGIVSGSGSGIYNRSEYSGTSVIESLKNNGIVSGSGSGIYNYSTDTDSTSKIGNLVNIGNISGDRDGISNSIGIRGKASEIGNITNIGVVYGKTNAIRNSVGTITKVHNYGLLVSSTGSVVNGLTTVTEEEKKKNYGLAFKIESDKYVLAEDYSVGYGIISKDKDIVMGYEKKDGGSGELDFNKPITEKYTIINAKSKGESSGSVSGTVSLTLRDGMLFHDGSEKSGIEDFSLDKKYILNGITNTLEVKGTGNKLNNSVINAYTTAVVMNENKSMITLDNTVVNGGMKENTTTVNIDCDGSALTVKGNSVINVRDGGTAITVTGNDNAVVLKGNTIVNGKMEANGYRNILDLDGTGKDGMNMHHDITGFEKMAIDNNVTFSEDMTVTGTTEVKVEETGVLNLRLKKDLTAPASVDDTPPTATHAFSGTAGMTIEGSGEGGTLNFITNGIGRVIDVDMEKIKLENMKIKASSIIDKAEIHEDFIRLGAGSALGEIVNPKEVKRYGQLNKIYKSIYSSREENLDGLRDILSLSTYLGKNYDYNNRIEAEKEEQLASLLGYLTSVYIESPYSYSSELSRRSMGMFRDIVVDNIFKPETNKWMIYGGLTHIDGGTKDTYYGKGYYTYDIGSSDMDVDTKITGAYMLGEYGISDTLTSGVVIGGNKLKSDLSNGSKVDGSAMYLGAYAKKYIGNLKVTVGAGFQYGDYDADRMAVNKVASDETKAVMKYSDNYNDITYDIYLNGRYSNPIGDNLFLEPYATLSYTYIDQDGANEGSKALAIGTDSKTFEYTVGKAGVDLKKVIPHEKGKSTLSAGVSYTKILDGAEEEYITGRFKGGSDFDILVAHKNEHSIGLNAKYALELENGVLFDIKGTYSIERDSHNGSAKNKTKGEWIVGAGVGYKF